MKTIAWQTVLFSLIFAVAGCSSFNREWRRAAQIEPNGITGRWEGTWRSEANGHHGGLRCLITVDSQGKYSARFKATYLKILKFGYTMAMVVEERDSVWHFRGEEDLGAFAGGLYHYEGQITATNFFSTYRAKSDHGVFELTRP